MDSEVIWELQKNYLTQLQFLEALLILRITSILLQYKLAQIQLRDLLDMLNITVLVIQGITLRNNLNNHSYVNDGSTWVHYDDQIVSTIKGVPAVMHQGSKEVYLAWLESN